MRSGPCATGVGAFRLGASTTRRRRRVYVAQVATAGFEASDAFWDAAARAAVPLMRDPEQAQTQNIANCLWSTCCVEIKQRVGLCGAWNLMSPQATQNLAMVLPPYGKNYFRSSRTPPRCGSTSSTPRSSGTP